jgi:hypothetical protein
MTRTGNAAACITAACALHATPLPELGAINPSTKSKADWTAYLQADKHAKGKDTVSKYVSKAYRASIKDRNKAAEKFADTPDQELPMTSRHF